jgi:hypothetical protein
VIDVTTEDVVCAATGPGRAHDFRVFKMSRVRPHPATECLGDKGYQGLQKLHANGRTPHKRPPRGQLTDAQRRENRALARRRVRCEHVLRRLKVFRILAGRYRNRRRRYGLRLHLLCGLYNRRQHWRRIHAQGQESTPQPAPSDDVGLS